MKKIGKISICFLLLLTICGSMIGLKNLHVEGATPSSTIKVYPEGTFNCAESREVLELVNEQREANGLNPLTMTVTLEDIAMQRAGETGGYYSHTRPDGTRCFEIVNEYGLSYRSAGENIAYGYTDAEDVMNGWMNSEGHRANILNANFTHMGIGCFEYKSRYGSTKYWVQFFVGTPSDTTEAPQNGSDSIVTSMDEEWSYLFDTTLISDRKFMFEDSQTALYLGETMEFDLCLTDTYGYKVGRISSSDLDSANGGIVYGGNKAVIVNGNEISITDEKALGESTITANIGTISTTKTINVCCRHEEEYQKTESKDAACETDGYVRVICTRCNTTLSEEVIEGGHTSVTDNAVAATCETAGLTEGSHCSVCGEVFVAQETIPALGHDFNEVEEVKATCTDDGCEAGKECTRCDYIEGFAVIPALGHTEVIDEAVDATCEETGFTEGSHCSVCDEVLIAQETLPALGHSLNEVEEVKATCTENGCEAGKECTRCDYTEGFAVIPETGHNEVTLTAEEATCTETGLSEGKYCNVCGEILTAQQKIDALGHDLKNVAKVPSTCMQTGKEAGKECTRCDYTEGFEIIPLGNHINEVLDSVAATCEETGLTEGIRCSVCKKILVEQEIMPALGHELIDVEAIQATCVEVGREAGKECTRCAYTEGCQLIEAKGHRKTEVITPASFDNSGKIKVSCTVCESVIKNELIEQVNIPTLSYEKTVYNGNAKKPAVTVKDTSGYKLINGTDYNVTYGTGRKNVGRYKVTVTLKGNYAGSKTMYFIIVPKKTGSLSAIRYQYGNQVRLTWTKSTGATGYRIEYKKPGATKYTFLANTKNLNYTKGSLTANKTYYFKVTPYVEMNGTKYYSTETSAYRTASIATVTKGKKLTQVVKPTVAKSGTKVKVSWKNIANETGYEISQSTSSTGTKIVKTYKTTTGKNCLVSATKGKKYYYKVRAYRTVNGKKIYGPWSAVKAYTRK